jgi:hypothetical protein
MSGAEMVFSDFVFFAFVSGATGGAMCEGKVNGLRAATFAELRIALSFRVFPAPPAAGPVCFCRAGEFDG